MQVSEQWLKAAKAELDGADPFEKLTSAKGNIHVKPWYDRFDVQKDQTFVLPAEKSWLGARSWVNAPLIEVKDVAAANKNALQQLADGADGIFFDLGQAAEEVNQSVLLENIQLEHCSVFFKNNYKFHLQHTNESTEISLAKLLDSFVEHISTGNNVPRSMEECAVLIETGNDFFLEIARLKALRVLWNGLCKAYSNPGTHLMIHSIVSPWISEPYQPHGNMIAATSRALSAVLGGCNALTVIAEDQADNTATRIARNVSLVFREESHISKTGDPTAGSYYVDSLVRDIVEKSWIEFQRLQE